MRCVSRLLIVLVAFGVSANAGRIVVNHDEWTTSDTGFASAGVANTTAFVENLATFLNGGPGPGSFLVYSSNPIGFGGASFVNAMTSAGHALTVNPAITFDLATLLTFDGVFLALPPSADTTVLTNYVNAGGSVYLAAGTGQGGATAEADLWNPFLNNFGLGLQGGSYNGISGVLPVTGVHPILTGVSSLYYNNGSTVLLVGGNPNAQIIEQTGAAAPVGLIGVYDDLGAPEVPEPSTWLLLTTGLGVALFFKRRRN